MKMWGLFFIMIDLHFHPFRKALQLSLNEMAVLREIYELSNNSKFGGWCIKSKSKIADTLDLSKQSIINIMGVLESKGYIIYDRSSGYCKPSDMIRDLSAEREEIGFVIKSDGYEIASAKMKQIVDSMQKSESVQNLDDSPKSLRGAKKIDSNVQKLDTSISYSKSISKEEYILSDFEIFEQFWNAYDRKEGRKRAEQEWKKLSEQDKKIALAHAQKYSAAREQKFRKSPAKYLADREFENEVIIGSAKKEQSTFLSKEQTEKQRAFENNWNWALKNFKYDPDAPYKTFGSKSDCMKFFEANGGTYSLEKHNYYMQNSVRP